MFTAILISSVIITGAVTVLVKEFDNKGLDLFKKDKEDK